MLVRGGAVLLVAGGAVYDATDYAAKHPGGERCIVAKRGTDVSFDMGMHTGPSLRLWERYRVAALGPCAASKTSAHGEGARRWPGADACAIC